MGQDTPKISVAIGAAIGLVLAWILELTHHSAFSVLLLVACAVLPTFFFLLPRERNMLQEFFVWCYSLQSHTRAALVFLLITITVALAYRLNVNPNREHYIPLLPAVLVSGILFGARSGLLATVLSLLAADVLFTRESGVPFSITDGKTIAALISFAVLGSIVAWTFSVFLIVAQEERENSEMGG
jgi:K+-sensing histidine kinase KdpD